MGWGCFLEEVTPETKGETYFQETERWATPGEGAAGPSLANPPGMGLRNMWSAWWEVARQGGSGHKAPIEP